MKGDATVIKNLNVAASLEAGLVAQYRLDKRLLDDMGLSGLKTGKRKKLSESILKAITDRILFLEGTPDYEIATPADSGALTALLERELALETAVSKQYQIFCKQAWDVPDDNTRNLYEHWIKWHEDDNIDYLEEQLQLIATIGEANYIQEKM